MAMEIRRFDVCLANLDLTITLDKTRLIKNLGTISSDAQLKVISVLQRLFAF
ncbi:MAG: hypothetical protein JW927_01245 [Deltaproteobacteria bacterium]|nr:hypothetical protein [Deltaproteobacteria bacterium]